jgi:hypothetical protein
MRGGNKLTEEAMSEEGEEIGWAVAGEAESAAS